MALGWVLWATVAVAQPPQHFCGVRSLVATHGAEVLVAQDWRVTRSAGTSSTFPEDELDLRDAFGVPNVATSEHFAVRWGNSGAIEADDVAELLEAFELGWSVHIDEVGHLPPLGSDTHRFNVYLGDTGDGAPPSGGFGGYFTLDPEDWPMVVINPANLAQARTTEAVALHEFYHAVQFATARYPYEGISAWWIEATAEWAALHAAPDNPFIGSFVLAYGGLTELPLPFFDFPDSGAIDEVYQYGAFVFPVHLAEIAGPEIIRDTWLDPSDELDPLEVVRGRLEGQSIELNDVFLEHIARNATWDYAQGALWASFVESGAQQFGLEPLLVRHLREGSGGPQSPGARAPGHYGYNLIELSQPDRGELHVSITGAPSGSRGSPASFGARLVRVVDDDVSYETVPFEGANGELSLPITGNESSLFLVVGAWSMSIGDDWLDERFDYTYEMAITPEAAPAPADEPPSDDGDESPRGQCGCQTPPGGGATAPLALILAWMACAFIRRRT